MDSLSKKQSLLSEENVNLSAFHRRNKILILILIFLIISLTVIIGALIITLIQDNTSTDYTNPAVGAFCMVSNDTSSCLSSFDPIISPKSRTDPNHIFTLSLQTAAQELQKLISNDFNTTAIITFNNCSVSLRDGLRRLGDALGTMLRVNPFVQMLSDEQRSQMTNWIYAAEKDLRSCLEELDQVAESTAVTANVLRVKEFVSNSKDFLREYGRVLEIFSNGIYSDEEWGFDFITGNLFRVWSVWIGGVQYLFILILVLLLFKIR